MIVTLVFNFAGEVLYLLNRYPIKGNMLILRLFIVLFAGCFLSVTAQAESKKIVAILPLTGPLANVGKELQNAISLQDTKSIQIEFDDDGFDPKRTVSAVKKALTNPEVKGFIFFTSGTSLAAKPLIERAKVPGIAIAFSDKIGENADFMFRYHASTESQAELIIKELKKRNYRNVVFLVSQQEAMLGFQSYFQKNLPFSRSNYLEVSPGDVDLKSIAAKAIGRNPDAICLLLNPPELPVFAKQVRALGYKNDFFGPSHLSNPAAVTAAAGSLEDTWLAGVDDSFATEFAARFRERVGTEPMSEAISAYDAAGLLASAIATDNPSEYLKNPKGFLGVFGERLTVTKANTFEPPLTLEKIKGPRSVPVQ